MRYTQQRFIAYDEQRVARYHHEDWEILLSLLLSVLALLATFYQLYLQRVHNEKSLKPLGQILLEDQQQTLAVQLRNNGLGPLIIDQITCRKNGMVYDSLEACLDLQPRSYMHPSIHDMATRVVLPGAFLTVFETRFDADEGEAALNHARQQLAPLTFQVTFHDIYDNTMTIERALDWFLRHAIQEGTP